ncbi:hypothetical protein HZC09_06060 [Candidatus Micrarchaeota archaeon]|nr:hypothetical protein [Candidatus Micrarchaeota archaeon]
MRVITLSINEETDDLLRKMANEEYQGRKGSLSKIVEEGIRTVAQKKEAEEALQNQLKIMKKGLQLGGGPYYKKRSELYEKP